MPAAARSSAGMQRKSLLSNPPADEWKDAMISDRPICVAGAGSIGCFVGGLYAAAGRRVALLARPRVIEEIDGHGLRLTGFDGLERRIAVDRLMLSENPSIFNNAGAVLVSVKSADTADIADLIARHAPADAVIISLQNGVGNVPVLRQRLPGRRVVAGMMAFNVVAGGEGRFHRATSGDIVLEQDEAGTANALSVPGLKLRPTPDIAGVQWGKLLVNLNNALNALSDLPLRQQLAQRGWRRLFADQMAEGLRVVKAEAIRPVSSTPVPAGLTPHLLRLPDAVFATLLRGAMKVDPEARSSMWEDLQRGRRTEIDHLQGVIIAIAEQRGLQVPLSRCVLALVKAAEAAGKGAPGLTVEQIRPQSRGSRAVALKRRSSSANLHRLATRIGRVDAGRKDAPGGKR
jgi:2-dehydropantoate 2-reductase